MISIVIPVYNTEKFLPHCLDSILAQTSYDWECILIDDGSSDNSSIICDNFAARDHRIRVIHQQNAGVSAARNVGIECANGDWITFVDSDDWIEPEYLSNFNIKNEEADIIVQGMQYINHNTGQVLEYKKLENVTINKTCSQYIIIRNDLFLYGYPVCKAYRSSFIQKHNLRFDTSLSTHEDIIFALQSYVFARKIVLRERTLYNYRYYHSSNTLSSKVHPWGETLASSVKMFEMMSNAVAHYVVTDKQYLTYVYSRCMAPRIKALFDVEYRDFSSYYKNIVCILQERQKFVKYFRPSSFRYWLIKMLITCRLDFLLCVVLLTFKAAKQIEK